MGATKTVQAHAAALELWGPGIWATYIFMVQSFAPSWLMNTPPATTSFQFSALIFASVKICSCSRSLSVAFLSKSNTTFRAKRRRRTPLLCVSLQLPCWPKFHSTKKKKKKTPQKLLPHLNFQCLQSSVNTPFHYRAEICTVTVYYQGNLLSKRFVWHTN